VTGTLVRVEARRGLSGVIRAPGDKSISHRALLLSALGEGTSSISGLSHGHDVGRTQRIISQLGAQVSSTGDGCVHVLGGRDRLSVADEDLECGNSGTTMRLVMGLISGLDGVSRLVGDHSLSRRPMDRVAQPLRLMGAHIEGQGVSCTAPVTVSGGPLRGIDYLVPVPSAQVKSAVLLAGLWANEPTIVREPIPTRPHTEEMLLDAGVPLRVTSGPEGSTIVLEPSTVSARDWVVPADPSQAAFFIIAGVLASSGEVSCTGLYRGATRTGFLGVLQRMGAVLETSEQDDGTLSITATSSSLRATDVDSAEIPSLDEVPILVVAACAASGISRFVDVGELRIKESDRFETSLSLACALGAKAWAEGDTLCVEGLGSASRFSPLEVDSVGDHRIAMAAAIAGAVGQGAAITGFDAVATSYPAFLEDLEGLR